MHAWRSLVMGFTLATSVWLLGAPVPAAAVNNNLNLIPSRGVQFGIVKLAGHLIHVKLQRARQPSEISNNSNLRIFEALPGAGAPPVFDGTPGDPKPFDTTFPNGAYAFEDPNHDLLAWRGCAQAGSSGGGWDTNLVYCPKTGVTKIKITTGPGDYDLIQVDPAVIVPLAIRCSGRQDLCGTNCLSEEIYTCCDAVTGCFTMGDVTCAEECP